jgi:hypothetical protein
MSTEKVPRQNAYPLGEYVLHMGAGFVAKERPHVVEVFRFAP